VSQFYELEGIALAGGRRIALVRHKRTKELISISPGSELAGWRVTRLRSRWAYFKLGERRDKLELNQEDKKTDIRRNFIRQR